MRLCVVSVLAALTSCGWTALPGDYPYSPAMYTSVAGVSHEVIVFPPRANAFSIKLPFALGPFAFSPDGSAIFAAMLDDPLTPKLGLFEIELRTGDVKRVAGTESVGVESLAVARDGRLAITGGVRGAPCSIFTYDPARGYVTRVASATPCDPMDAISHWTDVSISPDTPRAVATRNHALELINLSNGIIISVPGSFMSGAWSPDGKWLAVERRGSDRTTLLDARTFVQRRQVGPTNLVWSPDSRYLLAAKRGVLCGPTAASFQVTDIETGERFDLAGSDCRIDRGGIGWVLTGLKAHPDLGLVPPLFNLRLRYCNASGDAVFSPGPAVGEPTLRRSAT